MGRPLARKEGKSLPESVGEVARAGHIFKFFAGEVVRQVDDRLAAVRPGVEVDVTREPIGGTKGSSFGARERGHYAAEFYTAVKTAYALPQ